MLQEPLDQSPAEKYAYELASDEPKYYSQIPTALFYCTYLEEQKDGSSIRKKLSCNAIALYTLIKAIAGTQSACWASRETLAERLGRSTGAVSAALKELQMSMEQLNNSPIIKVEKRTRRHLGGPGASQYNHVMLLNIWGPANAFMSIRANTKDLELGPVHNPSSPSNNDAEGGAMSNNDAAFPGTASTIDTIKITEKKNPSVITEEPAACAAKSCSSIKSESVNSVIEEHQESKKQAENQMRDFGCDENFISEMLKRFTPRRIVDGGIYTCQQIKRKTIDNRLGYLRSSIETGRKWYGSTTQRKYGG